MAQPKVSILISFYNLAPYVDETLQSVLNQKTDFPIEVLCADDGSADNTVEKLRQWEKRYPETVRVFVMDFIPGEKRPPDVRIKRLNAIRSRLSVRPREHISAIWTATIFIPIRISCRSKRIFWMQIPRKSMLPAAITAVSIGKVQEKRDPLKSPSGNAA